MIESSIVELKALLGKLNQLASRMNDILKDEQVLLNSPKKAKQLVATAKSKKEVIAALEQSTRVTHKFLLSQSISNGLYGLSNFIDSMQSNNKQELNGLWLSTKEQIEHNKQLNELNGSIIELNRRFTQRSLDVLRGQMGAKTETYGADGHSQKSSLSRNISIA